MSECKKRPTLYDSSEACCGCGACSAVCPKGAIAMTEDARGFVFPCLNEDLCVGCGACERACGLHARLGGESVGPWYAAAGKGDVSASASGGVFAALARSVIECGGCVFGAAYDACEDNLLVRHAMAENEQELGSLLNSKYVQSNAGCSFAEVRQQLRTGRQVLFCGTPCQVAGLRGFLARDWENLTTVDLVCHGVPSERLFNSYVHELSNRFGSPVSDIRFRCKRNGWGHSLLLLLLLKDGREIEITADQSPYYDMFLKLKTLRDSCYVCPYAGSFRAGDLTIGDFWGIERNRPDLIGDGLDVMRGISCLLINNERGKKAIDCFGQGLAKKEVTFDEIAKGNDQLRHPSVLPVDRDMYLQAFEKSDWSGIAHVWRRRERGPLHFAKVTAGKVLPPSLKKSIKDALRKARA